ncbi:Homeodomain (HD) containing transcription factor TALE class [Oopsacas minuta]|uniref:Homeodomain (HD) containing transcription factor TALE class n=1 Tax=Oopsacas minuta TaxID=111878 RepID=A0AAV7KC03_9METZ|nr:Homeodomain (HD) containing transcription factor TALE class [Oopsacas minuta]
MEHSNYQQSPSNYNTCNFINSNCYPQNSFEDLYNIALYAYNDSCSYTANNIQGINSTCQYSQFPSFYVKELSPGDNIYSEQDYIAYEDNLYGIEPSYHNGNTNQIETERELQTCIDDVLSKALSGSIFENGLLEQENNLQTQERNDILEEMNEFIKSSENEIREYCQTTTSFYTNGCNDSIKRELGECREDGVGKKRPNFSPEQIMYLKSWLINNKNNPYPDEDVKDWICFHTNLTLTQLNYWLVNARRRFLPKLQSNCNVFCI